MRTWHATSLPAGVINWRYYRSGGCVSRIGFKKKVWQGDDALPHFGMVVCVLGLIATALARSYFSRIKMLIGVPVYSQLSRILFSR